MRGAAALALVALALPAGAHPGEAPAPPEFIPPAAGTYRLPPIQATPDGDVLDEKGHARALSQFTRGRITLLGLIYTRCADPEGCPRATWSFQEVRSLLRSIPGLQSRVRLVSLSFDAQHDVPAVLASYGARSRGASGGSAWHFLTAPSALGLAAILDGFGQDLRVASDSEDGPGTQAFTHTLKVFLLDSRGTVREIYSTAYLMPKMIVNDIRTLDLEQRRVARNIQAIRTR